MVYKNPKTAKIEELKDGKLDDCVNIEDENTCVNSYRWVFGTSTMTSSGLSYGCTWFNNHDCIRREDKNHDTRSVDKESLGEGFNATAPDVASAAPSPPVVLTPMQQLQACLEESITPSDVRACRAAADRVPASAIAAPAQPTASRSSQAAYSSQQEEQQSNATSPNATSPNTTSPNATSPKPVISEEAHARRKKAAKNKMERQWRRAQAAPCPTCGFGNGVPNCCSHGGAWAGSCTVTEEDGGEHTWEEGFNACFGTPLPPDAKLEELQKTEPKQKAGEHTTGGPKQRSTPEFNAMPKDLTRKLPALEDLPSSPDEPEADAKPLGEALAGKHIAVDAPSALNPYKKMPEGAEGATAPDGLAAPAGDGKGLPDLPEINGKLPDVKIPEQESESGDLVKAFKRELPDLPELTAPSNETSASASASSSSPTTAATATAEAAKPSSPSSSDPASRSEPAKAAAGEKPLLLRADPGRLGEERLHVPHLHRAVHLLLERAARRLRLEVDREPHSSQRCREWRHTH